MTLSQVEGNKSAEAVTYHGFPNYNESQIRIFLRIQGSHSAHRVADTICRGGVTTGKGSGRPVERSEARDPGEPTLERHQSIYFLTFGILGGQ